MKKLGGSLAFISGLVTLVFAIIAVLVAHNVFTADWAQSGVDSLSVTKGILWVTIVIAILQMAIGIWSIKNPTGIASFILLAFFAVEFILGIVHGVHSGQWPTTTIVILVVQGIAAFGLLSGFAKG